ncbi:mannitol dehydrogenase family protein [Brevundimonas sp.]
MANATLTDLPAEVERPGYDRAAVKTGVVHLGIGAFHRAHQAVVFDDALRSGDLRWGILGVSLRSPGVRDQLNPQDGLYSVVVRDGVADRTRIIGAVQGVLVAPEDPAAVVAAMASPDIHIVSLTVTEKGYRLDPASGGLLTEDPDVAADLADLSRPRTAPGFLVAALAERRRQGLAPFTVISCDNLPHNGARVRSAVQAMAEAHDPALAEWIATEGAFPQTMVDRIVPATTPDDIAAQGATLGVRDEGMVKTEPFTQWVVEDRFAGPRPDFAALRVQLTAEVAPWEDAKLRLLNGAHSSIAYLGGLAGHAFVHQVVAIPAFRAFVERLWDEAQTTLNPPPGLDIPAYRADLMARFSNPSLQHRTRQIAMDGSQKLPQRLLASIAARLDAEQSIDALALGVAGWIKWQGGVTETGETFTIDDPMAARLAETLSGATTAEDKVRAVSSLSEIVSPRLADDIRFTAAVTRGLKGITTDGVAGHLAKQA